MAEVKGPRLARLICLIIALAGTVVTGVPFFFELGSYTVIVILLGAGISVVALALFLFFSI